MSKIIWTILNFFVLEAECYDKNFNTKESKVTPVDRFINRDDRQRELYKIFDRRDMPHLRRRRIARLLHCYNDWLLGYAFAQVKPLS
ncbi:hypothetical protein [Duganella radicis]|uniref:Uncharacterized protein n=1 Tax=Duganella radicis TaxID=551988 RepID=A0A6L6PIJ6_9BURK|nr:hypothetical protein [Duganella radicis]MTV38377.1 hypothetical protein [Duganella radicis]